MPRFVRLIAVLSIVGVSAPALARCRRGVSVQVGNVFFGAHRPCVDVVIAPVVVAQAQPLPPVAYYTQPPVVYAPPPPPVYVQPAPQVYVQPAPVVVQQPPPVVYANPPIVYAQPAPAPVVRAKAPPPADDNRPGFLAIKYMPGVSSTVAVTNGDMNFGGPGFAHSPGLELRITRWLSLRSDLEFRKEGRTWDMLGVKLSLLPRSPIKPYASVAFSGNENYSNPGKYSFGFAGAAGVDLMLGKHFFLEAEGRYRMTPGACCSDVPVVAGVIGGGVAFF